ncbi:MAG: branched-chain amino acid ABC transporter permease [Gudongella sp.]|nr:branched-chain amino acid ABC transporter permease [Gudongella sp.]
MKLRESNLFRFISFVLIPLTIIVYAGFDRGGYYTGLINLVGINIILVASLNLVNGFSGMFSMGHAAFMAIGAYASAMLTLSEVQKLTLMPGLPEWLMALVLPFPITLLIGGIFAAIVALFIGFPVLRFKGHYLSVATIGLIIIVRAVLDNEDQLTNGARGITGLSSHSSTWIIFAIAIIFMFILHRLLNSAYGRGLIAMRDDYTAAQTLGVNLTTKKLSAFCISAFMAGVGGGLWAHMINVISGKFFYIEYSFKIVETSIIGGMYSISGSVIGSILMTYIPELLAPLENGLKIFGTRLPELYGISNIILAVLLIIIIIFRRQGIMGYSEIITESIFSIDTYKSVFQKQEYYKLLKIVGYKIKRIGSIPGYISNRILNRDNKEGK